ncbi:hypothetical protein BRC20_00395 [Candidatus Saccharibacteria bacterium QS_8_54_8]|nr:MAG: hypothetical protein BRC20_00395 [Candidatus Saccharibacteria bacterium QS_8_54_8]
MPVIKRLIHFLVPDTCLYCGSEGSMACHGCLPWMVTPKSSTCFLCNRQTRDFATCQRCARKTPLSRVYIAGYYEGYTKELVFRLKYHNGVSAAASLAALMEECLRRDCDVIVPVPASSRRFRQRGYNQAVLLSKHLSRQHGAPHVEALGRVGQSRQVGVDRKSRLTQLQGDIYARKERLVRGQRVLLVDDVLTTGTTLHECAAALKRAGARSVDAVVAAKH